MRDEAMRELAQRFVDVAARAALGYLEAKGLRARLRETPAWREAFIEAIRRHVAAAVSPALDEASEAVKVGLAAFAVPSALATVALAGIEAGKEVEVLMSGGGEVH